MDCLDYCNALLARCHEATSCPLHGVLSSDAFLIFTANLHQSCTPFIMRLHRLPVCFSLLEHYHWRSPYLPFLSNFFLSANSCPSFFRQSSSVFRPLQTQITYSLPYYGAYSSVILCPRILDFHPLSHPSHLTCTIFNSNT